MVSAKGMDYGNTRTTGLISVSEAEGKAGLQLFGSDPEVLSRTAAAVCAEYADRIALLDINMGCPALKIVKNGEGCALMRDIALAGRIIEAVKAASSLPVTVKFRKGWDEDSVNAVEFARVAEDAGADGVTLHGRTREQFYSGAADWNIIGEVKASVNIPVVGNGDIFGSRDAFEMMRRTGCDAVMAGRGALGNPFIFREMLALQNGETPAAPELGEKVAVALEHLRLLVADKGERRGVREFRKHAAWYAKGYRQAAKFRERAVQAETAADMESLFHALLNGF